MKEFTQTTPIINRHQPFPHRNIHQSSSTTPSPQIQKQWHHLQPLGHTNPSNTRTPLLLTHNQCRPITPLSTANLVRPINDSSVIKDSPINMVTWSIIGKIFMQIIRAIPRFTCLKEKVILIKTICNGWRTVMKVN